MRQLIANPSAYETFAAYLRGGRLPHALLIEGPDGCGKTTFALYAAQAVVCSSSLEQRPCGSCRDCIKAEKGVHPDILTFGGEGGSRSFHIDVVREIRRQAVIRPNEAGAKAMLLRNTHEMSIQAQNALLKLIEEPPPGVVFLLTCQNRAQMLETVLSRVQVIALALPSVQQATEYLQQRLPEQDSSSIQQAVAQAGGNIGAALARLDGEDDTTDPVPGILYNICAGDELEAMAALCAYERDRPAFAQLLAQLRAAFSGFLLHPSPDSTLAPFMQRTSRLQQMAILAIMEDAEQAAAQNANVLLLATTLCARIRATASSSCTELEELCKM